MQKNINGPLNALSKTLKDEGLKDKAAELSKRFSHVFSKTAKEDPEDIIKKRTIDTE